MPDLVCDDCGNVILQHVPAVFAAGKVECEPCCSGRLTRFHRDNALSRHYGVWPEMHIGHREACSGCLRPMYRASGSRPDHSPPFCSAECELAKQKNCQSA